jgi:hypothetical protein
LGKQFWGKIYEPVIEVNIQFVILREAHRAFWQIDRPLESCVPGYDAKCYLFVFYVKTAFLSEAL